MTTPRLTPEEFQTGLKLHRDRLGMTQKEASDECRVALRTYAMWELGLAVPSYPAQCGALGILRKAKIQKAKAA